MSTEDPLLAAVERLRASKARWGSYAIDHDAIDALADLLAAIGEHDQADDPHEWETCFIAVRERADALASHLTEGSGNATT